MLRTNKQTDTQKEKQTALKPPTRADRLRWARVITVTVTDTGVTQNKRGSDEIRLKTHLFVSMYVSMFV